uniref:Uncharacterized protein n=1 Tax=Mustela putorius furo TaxID=9669 RepID=M3YDX7_MUSPF
SSDFQSCLRMSVFIHCSEVVHRLFIFERSLGLRTLPLKKKEELEFRIINNIIPLKLLKMECIARLMRF